MAWAAIVGGVVAAGTTAYAASQKPKSAGGDVSYGETTDQILKAQRDALAPDYKANMGAGGSLDQAGLASKVSYQNMFGTKGGAPVYGYGQVSPGQGDAIWANVNDGKELSAYNQSRVNYYRHELGYSDEKIAQVMPEIKIAHYSIRDPVYGQVITNGQTEATPGTLDMAEQAAPRLNALAADAASYARTRGVEDVTRLSPAIMNSLRSYDGRQTAGADLLYDQTYADAAKGAQMDQSMIRSDEQKSRNSWASVLGYSPEAAVQERMSLGYAGLALKNQRQTALGNVLNQRQALYGSPYSVLGIGGTATAPLNSFSTAGPAPINGASAIGAAAQLYGQQQGYQNQANIAQYNQNQGAIGNYGKIAGNTFASLYNSGSNNSWDNSVDWNLFNNGG